METEPQIIENYIRTGKARLVYRHLLQLGAGSLALAEASECAGAQGKFWEMRTMIYQRQDELHAATSADDMQPLVEALELDAGRFSQCMEQHQFEAQVRKDHASAENEGVRARPVLAIDGTRLVGAQPFERIQAVLDGVR